MNLPHPNPSPKLLIVDDNPHVLPILERWAKLAGYDPIPAASGQDALDAWGEHEGIVAVVTDIRMPRMDGMELVTALRALSPGLPVVFISGFSGSAESPHLDYEPHAAFVMKPFRLKDLDEALASVRAV